MRPLLAFIAATLACSAFSAPGAVCYKISKDGTSWSRTPEEICFFEHQNGKTTIVMRTGLFQKETIGSFSLSKIKEGHYGVTNPENSTFNALSVKLRDTSEGCELKIGKTHFVCQKLKTEN
jgi:hypothetical protein